MTTSDPKGGSGSPIGSSLDRDADAAFRAASPSMPFLLDPAVLTQLANQMFSAIPGATLPAIPTIPSVPAVPGAAMPAMPGAAIPGVSLDSTRAQVPAMPGAAMATDPRAALTGDPSSAQAAAPMIPQSLNLMPLVIPGAPPAAMPSTAIAPTTASIAVPGTAMRGPDLPGASSLSSLGSSAYFLQEANAAMRTVGSPAFQAYDLDPQSLGLQPQQYGMNDPLLANAMRAPGFPSANSAFDSLYFLDEARAAMQSVGAPGFESFEYDPATLAFQPELMDLGLSGHQFDVSAVRRDFPILQEQVHGRPLIWLDNAATTQKPNAVIDRLSNFYRHENSNIHRAAHVLAGRATDAYEASREKVRRFINAPSTKEIVFVRGATEAINLVAQSWARRYVGRDDEIVISWLEHHSNIVPWQLLCSEKGARLKVAPIDDRGQIILEEYAKLLGPRTRLVSFAHVSNALGTVTPVREMTELAHRHGAKVLVDGAQAVSHMRVDVQALDCDFYAFSGHKIFAPTGIGVLYGKPEVLEAAPPWQGGGNMIIDVTFEKTVYQPPPMRFEAGTGNIADAVGLGAALDYLDKIGMENINRHEHELMRYATEGLSAIPGLRLIGTAAEKAGVLSFVLDGFRTEDVGQALDKEGIAVRAGHHCAQPALRRFGVESSVRPSLALYNSCEDIDALIAAIRRIAGRGV